MTGVRADDGHDRLEILEGDITTLRVDAIVNAANETLLGGGGVDGAIHDAAGPRLLEECRTLGGCPTGEARITKGYDLPARHVIHTVGPIYRDGRHGEPERLAAAYRRSLELAIAHGLESVVFPSISTGVYRYPIAEAARIALRTIREVLETNRTLRTVAMICHSRRDFEVYVAARREVFGE